jgi:outer membrane immunogenic protein
MKKLVAVCAAFCALTLPAFAADVSVLGTYTPPRPVYSWTGCRLGANIGGGSARTSWNDPLGTFVSPPAGTPAGVPVYLGDHTASGVVGGVQLGCDYQVGRVVFGIQGLYDLTGMKASNIQGQPTTFTRVDPLSAVTTTFSLFLINNTFIQSTANITGRIGYAVQPNLLLYAKGGVAWNHNLYNVQLPNVQASNVAPTVTPTGTGSVTVTLAPSLIAALGNNSPVGPLVGTGLEWAVFGTDLSLFLEYDYMHFGTQRVTFLSTLLGTKTFPVDITQNVNMVLFGINYRFYGGAPSY